MDFNAVSPILKASSISSIYGLGSLKTNTIELGIALLLPERIEKSAISLNAELAKQFSGVENKKNYFHISLFQGRFNRADIDALIDKLEALGNSNKQFNITLAHEPEKVGDNIFWNVENAETEKDVEKNTPLQAIHESVVKTFSEYRNGIMQQYQDSMPSLSEAQRGEIDNYGITNVMNNFKPHITLLYAIPKAKAKAKQTEDFSKTLPTPNQLPLAFSVTRIGLGKLGYDGDVVEWMSIVPLKSI